MTYYPDLSRFEYFPVDDGGVIPLNVGWLAAKHEVPRGDTSDEFRDELFRLVGRPWVRSCGYHGCEIDRCRDGERWGLTESRLGQSVKLGANIILVEGSDGTRHAAPDLIYHYVVKHSYLPPMAFVEAVSGGRSPQ